MTKEEIISLIRVDRNGEPWYTIKEVEDAMQQYADQECAAKDKRIKELEEGLRQIDAISFNKNEWKEMAEIGEIAKQLLTPKTK